MHKRRVRQWAVLIVVTLLTVCCGVRYLSEPPPEFDDYVQSIPVPSEATLLSEYTYSSTSPKEICTNFVVDRLYGTDQTYQAVKLALEEGFDLLGADYVKVESDANFVSYVLSDVGVVSAYHVTADHPVAEVAIRQHGADIVASGQAEYVTLFAIAIEHGYGNCAPHPWWPK